MNWLIDFLQLDPISSLTYIFAFGSVISFWIKNNPRLWGTLTILAIAFGFLGERINLIGITVLFGLFIILNEMHRQQKAALLVLEIIAVCLSIGLIKHKFPGFNNLPLLQNVRLATNSTYYSLYWNLDSLLCGVLLLGLSIDAAKNKLQWKKALKATLIFLICIVFVQLILVWILGFVAFDPKIPYFWAAWILENLLIVSVSEEAIYRGLILDRLNRYLPSKLGSAVSLIISSILFAYIHSGPFIYLALCFLAGLFYGGAYLYSKRIEAAILVHFLFNLIHILLFSYPALSK